MRSNPFEEELVYKPVRFLSRATFDELIESPFVQVQNGDTVLSILNGTRFQFTNSGSVSVTDLTDAQDGQLVALLGDGNTTLIDNARLALGSNQLLEIDKIILLIYQSGAWYPIVSTAAVDSIDIQAYTANHTIVLARQATQIDANTVSGNITLTLPDAALSTGKIIYVTKTSAANTVTVAAAGTDTINGVANDAWTTLNLTKAFVSIGSGTWRIVSSS